MSVEDKHDDLLLNILKEEGHIIPFLDAIFGFLHRRTDFYIVPDNSAAKVGFPSGVAERVVRDTFRKWQKQTTDSSEQNLSSMQGDLTDLVIHEEEVVTSENTSESLMQAVPEPNSNKPRQDDLSSETHNGADCGNYRWSQTLEEVDIKIPVPSCDGVSVNRSALKVDISTDHLSVSVRGADGQCTSLVSGKLVHRHRKEEAVWTLVGSVLSIYLQKATEKWWDQLLETEPHLDLKTLDTSRHVTDLPEEDHMQVEKVMVQEQRKRQGLVSNEQQRQLKVLQNAWNTEGSPFQGTPFDPSVLQFPSS